MQNFREYISSSSDCVPKVSSFTRHISWYYGWNL